MLRGGKAIADINSVTDPKGAKKMIESCVENFGKIDILICNAGIVKFTNFADVTSKELHDVVDVSVWGSVYPVHAAWKYMNAEGYGRIVLTTSQAGLWGQANSAGYALAKASMIGFGRAIVQDLKEDVDIKVNIIAPAAYTPMSAMHIPDHMIEQQAPEKVSRLVSFLSSANCKESGMIFNVGGGKVRQVRLLESDIASLPENGIDELPIELSNLNGPAEAKHSFEAGGHLH